jgi:hypothetical protein
VSVHCDPVAQFNNTDPFLNNPEYFVADALTDDAFCGKYAQLNVADVVP